MRGVVTLFTCVNEIIFYVTLVDAGPVVGSDFFFSSELQSVSDYLSGPQPRAFCTDGERDGLSLIHI